MTTEDIMKQVKKFAEATVAERQAWDGLYQQISDYMAPQRSAFTTDIPAGATGMDNLFEDEAIWAAEQFSLGVHSANNSPLSKWFTLELKGEMSDIEEAEALAWQEIATDWCYEQFNSPRGSFHPMTGSVYHDLGLFGYGVGYGEWNEKEDSMMYQSLFTGECYIIEDKYGRGEGLLRKFKEKHITLVERYGDQLDKETKDRLVKTPGDKVEMFHLILPKEHPMAQPFEKEVAKIHKYVSVRLCPAIKKDSPLKVGGFRHKPVYMARWGKRSGHAYPTSPGQTALPSVRRNNAGQRDMTIIVNRMAEPPTQGPDDGFLEPYDVSPSAKNYYKRGLQPHEKIEIVGGAFGDISPALSWLEQGQARIQRAFYVDAFLTTNDSNGQNVKATFVMQRRDERFRQLAAMLVRPEREYNSAVVMHTLQEGIDRKKIPPPPAGDIKIKYVSPIARAQRGEIVDGLLHTLEAVAPIAQQDPTVYDGFDKMAILEFVGRDVNSLPPSLLRTREEVEGIQRQREEAQAQEANLAESQVAKNLAGAAKDVSEVTQEALF